MSGNGAHLPDSLCIPRLQAEFKQRLDDLDGERRAIERALRALGGTQSSSRSRGRAHLKEQVMDMLRADPGARCTMLALALGRSADDVTALLLQLEQDALAERSGLGWRLCGPAQGTAGSPSRKRSAPPAGDPTVARRSPLRRPMRPGSDNASEVRLP